MSNRCSSLIRKTPPKKEDFLIGGFQSFSKEKINKTNNKKMMNKQKLIKNSMQKKLELILNI
jgi:hypothetical protein